MAPHELFRGDRDENRLRRVQESWNSGWLQTNLGAGGRGREIYGAPLIELVRRHVESEWERTHFLSFTSARVRAEDFAIGNLGLRLERLPDDAAHWDTSIFVWDLARLNRRESVAPGISRCTFKHASVQPDVGTIEGLLAVLPRVLQDQHRKDLEIPILLIDVLTALEAVPRDDPAWKAAQEKAMWDREWLILPLEPYVPRPGESGIPELTALLDDSCISVREKYRLV